MPNTGTNLKQARIAAGMSIDDAVYASRSELPETMWISRSKLSRIENGAEVPSYVIAAFANVYGGEAA